MLEFVLRRGNANYLKLHVISGLLLILPLCISCDSNNPIQPTVPSDNSKVLWECVVGDSEQRSSIRHIVVDDNLRLYLAGILNYKNTIWKISSGGDIEWARTLDFRAEGLDAVNCPSIAVDELILIWGNNIVNERERAVLLLVNLDGEIVQQYRFEHNEYDIWIKDIESMENDGVDTLFVGGGKAHKDDQSYPYMCRFSLSNEGNIEIRNENVLTDHVDEYIHNMTWNKKISAPEYFAILGGVTDYKVLGCSATFKELWNQTELPNHERWAYYKQIVYNEGTIYIAGTSYILKGDKYWWAGNVSAIRESGEYEWARIIELSNYDDVYFDCCVENGVLYAAGRKSGVPEKATNHYYGSALISKYDLSTGETVSHSSFGNKHYYSSFISIHHDGIRLFCGGVTQYFIYDYWFKGWIVEVDDGAFPDKTRTEGIQIVPKGISAVTPESAGQNGIPKL